MTPEVVERQATRVAGIKVVAPLAELPLKVPSAWRRIFEETHRGPFARRTYAEASRQSDEGLYEETIGYILDGEEAPAGLAVVELPAGRYIRFRHDGPLAEIAQSFAEMYDFAEQNGLEAGSLRLDIGYTPAGLEREHDLFIALRGGPGGGGQYQTHRGQ